MRRFTRPPSGSIRDLISIRILLRFSRFREEHCRIAFWIHYSIIPVLVLYHRDCGFNSFARQLLHVVAMNLGRLLVHGNHRPKRIAKPVVAVFRTVTPHGKVTHGSLAGIEMTVPHEVSRRIDGADAELVAHPRLTVLPEHDIALTLGDDDHGTGTVTVKGAARARRKFRNMTTVGGVRQGIAHVLYPFALHRKIIEGKLIHVRNEIGFPISVRHMPVKLQKLLAVMKTVAEVKRVTKNKILIVK